VLYFLHKDKILGPNGCTAEFFLGISELLGDDLLRVVEEVRLSEKLLILSVQNL